MKKSKIEKGTEPSGTIELFLYAKTIINQNSGNSPKIFQFSWKTSAAPFQC